MAKKKSNHAATTKKMRALLAEIARDYDFSQFTLEGFADWLEQLRGQPILFVPRSLPGTLFGAWLACDGCDFVFYEEKTAPVHQAHIRLHEMAHMLCGHATVHVSRGQIEVLLQQLGEDREASNLLLRSVHSDAAELESEILASLIQEQVLRHSRLQELTAPASLGDDFAAYFSAYIEGIEMA
jgi:hypothetical protein